MLKRVLLWFGLSAGVFGGEITLEYLKNQPMGVARDFYIWYFIDQKDTSLEDAKMAYELVFKKTPRIQKAMEKKGVIHEMPRNIYCKNLSIAALQKEDAECISYGLKLSSVGELKPSDVAVFLKKLKDEQPELYEQVQILSSKDVLGALMQTSAKNFAAIFTGLNYGQKTTLLESKKLDAKAMVRILEENDPAFNRVVGVMILDSKFDAMKRVLGEIEVAKSDTNTFFLLGINDLMLENPKKALYYFKKSQDTAYDPFMRDRALFWQYLISEDESYLKELAQSTFVDIFSIYANQKLKTTPKYEVISSFDENLTQPNKMDITNPFAWQIKRNEITKLEGKEYEDALKQFLHPETLPHYLFFLNRQYRYKHNYFIFAYDDPKMWRDDEQKAMTYAIARQESHLLPALISSSYALGMMQIMPFNVAPFAKEMGLKGITLFDMFKPQMALKFGSFFLDQLNREFKHPLFVAYAYNGGPGFLRRTLAKKRLFLKGRKYEPWLSMELLPYEESRFYGMKVLANYFIYAQMLKQDIDLESLLQKTIIFEKGK